MAPAKPTCKYWLQGTCKYGGQCRYFHESNTVVSQTLAKPVTSPHAPRTSEQKKLSRQLFEDREMMKSGGILLKEFDLSTTQKPIYPIEINQVNFIASYNWCNFDKPVIFVPGCPAKWSPPSLPYQVAKDKRQSSNTHKSNWSLAASFDPFFKALFTMEPHFDMKSIGLATDRNSLRKLLKYVSGKASQNWRIDVDIIEDTLFFTQYQISTGAQDTGYGHEFEKAFASYDSNLQETYEHNRIVRYNLGGIECLVRFEADGYIDDNLDITSTETTVNPTSIESKLSQAMLSLHVQNSASALVPTPATGVKVVERGRLIDNSTILELKSRSRTGNLKMEEIIPQMWISQTYHLFIGRHEEGLVEVEPERLDMKDYFPAWESKEQDHLSLLVGLITEIKEVVKKAKDGKCMLVYRKEKVQPKVLRIYERKGKPFFLFKEAREKYWGTEIKEQAERAQS